MSDWSLRDMPSQEGKVVVITGTGGIGFESGLALGRAGAALIIAGRNAQKGAEAVRKIQAVSPGKVSFSELDLASLASVQSFSHRILDAGVPIDVLINNAGVMMPKMRSLTSDGFELQFGVNHLGHFALTAQLRPALAQAPQPRVVTVSSGAHLGGTMFFDDLQFERRSYKPYKAYQQSKLANILFTRALQRRSDVAGWHLLAVAAHPGYARTNLIANGPGQWGPFGILSAIFNRIGQDAASGALPVLYAATSQVQPAGYYGPRGGLKGAPVQAKIGKPGLDDESGERLWGISEQLAGCRFG